MLHCLTIYSEVRSIVALDPTLALRLIEEAILKNNDSVVVNFALKVYGENSFNKSLDGVTLVKFFQ